MKKENYSGVLNKIVVALYILIALFAINLVFNILTTTKTFSLSSYIKGTTGNDANNNEEEEQGEYDVSKFKAVSYKELTEEIKSSDYKVVYVGRASCGYCVKFLPMMLQAQEEYGFTTLYFDITQTIDFSTGSVTDQDAYDGFIGMDDFFKENFGATPMVAVFKDGKYVNGTVGYTEYETYAKFIEDSGIAKK